MNEHTDSTAAAGAAMVNTLDAVDRLQVAVETINLVRMAAAGLKRDEMNAIARACFDAVDIIESVQDFLHPQEGAA